jgi:hypothetical protein
MRRLLLLTILLTSAACFAQVPIHGIPHRRPARTVASSYCRMDYEGARLSKESWPRLKALTTWKDNPEWRGFTVVSQYEVMTNDDGLRAATVGVRYSVLGRFEPGMGYTAERGIEDVSFHLKDVDSDWKVDDLDPAINPHVSKASAIAWLKTTLAAEKDAVSLIVLERALKTLGATPPAVVIDR